jgi:hypothetical protein
MANVRLSTTDRLPLSVTSCTLLAPGSHIVDSFAVTLNLVTVLKCWYPRSGQESPASRNRKFQYRLPIVLSYFGRFKSSTQLKSYFSEISVDYCSPPYRGLPNYLLPWDFSATLLSEFLHDACYRLCSAHLILGCQCEHTPYLILYFSMLLPFSLVG